MVKIRLSRFGTKGRPFYRVVVTEAATGRSGKSVDTLGTYDPTVKPTRFEIDGPKAIEWMLKGAQPTETTAILLHRAGILPQFLEQRPSQKKKFAFLDKRTAATSVPTAVEEAPAAE